LDLHDRRLFVVLTTRHVAAAERVTPCAHTNVTAALPFAIPLRVAILSHFCR
jgi:hypothetical protein